MCNFEKHLLGEKIIQDYIGSIVDVLNIETPQQIQASSSIQRSFYNKSIKSSL